MSRPSLPLEKPSTASTSSPPAAGGLIKPMTQPPLRPAVRPSSSNGASAPVLLGAASPPVERRREPPTTSLSGGTSGASEKKEKKKKPRTNNKEKSKTASPEAGGEEASSSKPPTPQVYTPPPPPSTTTPVDHHAEAHGDKKETPPVPARKGALRLTAKLKRKSSAGAGAAISKETKDAQQQQPPLQIGGVIAGSFQHHAHVSHTQSSTAPDAMDEMLKSINTALEAMGAGCLTSDEAKLILTNDSASLAKIAQQLQEEAETRREMSRRKRAPVQAQGPPPSQTSLLLARASVAPLVGPHAGSAPSGAASLANTSVAASVQASATAHQFLAATRPSAGGSTQSVRRKMLQVQQTLQEANQRLMREVEDLKLSKHALEGENKDLKRQVASSTPAPSSPVTHRPVTQLKGAGQRASGGMVVDFRTAQNIEKLKKDLDAEWHRAEGLSYVVIDLEEKRQMLEADKARLRDENQSLVVELEKLRENSNRASLWMQIKVSNAIEEVALLKEKLANETERADSFQQQTNKLKLENSSLTLELETAIASSTAEMNEARERFEQELKRIQSELYAEMEDIREHAEQELKLATGALAEKLTITEMYLEEERKIRTHLESARIEAQSRSEKFERRLHAHTAAGKGREDLLTKRLALAEEQKLRIEKDLANLREELTTSKAGGAVPINALEEKDSEIAELKRQLDEKNAVIEQQQCLLEASVPDIDEELALEDEADQMAAPPPPPPAAPAPPPPLVPAPPLVAVSQAAPMEASCAVAGASFGAVASGVTLASSLRDRLASTKLKKVDHEEIAREKEDNDTSVFNFLARALIARRNAISEEASGDEEEW